MKKQKANVLTIMCGLPRCGKSTWIKKNIGDAIVISPDDIRAKIFGHQFFKNSEDFVWAFAKAMVRMLLEQKKNVIIDGVNTTMGSRQTWLLMAKEYGIKLRIVWIKTSIKKCKERNVKSSRGSKIPYAVIDRMALCFENPYYMDDEDIELIQYPKNKMSPAKSVFENYYQKEVVNG